MTKTEQAMQYIAEGMTPYAAAKKAGITPTTVYVAIRRAEANKAAGKVVCPCCRSLVEKGRINQEVLKTPT